VRVGDLLRATSAAMMRMTYPTMQLVMGGEGRRGAGARGRLSWVKRVQSVGVHALRSPAGTLCTLLPTSLSRKIPCHQNAPHHDPAPGVGRPKLMRALVPTVGFPAAMDAVRSNKQLGEEITLYLERLAVDGGGAAGAVSVAAAAAAAVAGGLGGGAVESGEWQEPIKQQSAEGSVFDSSLFDDV
jgi:hypothetical protein